MTFGFLECVCSTCVEVLLTVTETHPRSLHVVICTCVCVVILLCYCLQLQEREWEDQLQLMRVAADVARKERDAQKLREKMREMGLHRYDESVL